MSQVQTTPYGLISAFIGTQVPGTRLNPYDFSFDQWKLSDSVSKTQRHNSRQWATRPVLIHKNHRLPVIIDRQSAGQKEEKDN